MNRLERKERFINELAKFLVANQVRNSCHMEMSKVNPMVYEHAAEWARLRNTTPLFGYPTVEEAEAIMKEFLS